MADPTFTTPPAQPVRGDTADTFKTKANVFVGYFSTLVTELTALVTWVNGIVTQVTADKDTTTNNVTVSTQNKDTATAQANIATTKAGEASASATYAGSAATASSNSASEALLSEQASALSAASVDQANIVHKPGSGLANEAGTAYAADLTTSATDTTVGRALKVGDFGLGANGTAKVRPTDFNAVTAAGFYVLGGGALNAPPTINACSLLHQDWDGVFTVATQTAVDVNSGYSFVRALGGGMWSDWHAILNSANEQQIGVNQAWQNVIASRATGVTYTNTTGKPIQVWVQLEIGVYNAIAIKVSHDGGATWIGVGWSSGTVITDTFAIIPAGAMYRVATAAVRLWSELR